MYGPGHSPLVVGKKNRHAIGGRNADADAPQGCYDRVPVRNLSRSDTAPVPEYEDPVPVYLIEPRYAREPEEAGRVSVGVPVGEAVRNPGE